MYLFIYGFSIMHLFMVFLLWLGFLKMNIKQNISDNFILASSLQDSEIVISIQGKYFQFKNITRTS